MSDAKNIDRLLSAIKASDKKKTSSYDAGATVRRIEGSTAWVHIDGGIDETPVKLTIDAKEGDRVQVRVGDGTAWITGNASAPPTDDARAIVADEKAGEAKKTAKEAYEYADIAKEAADSAVVSAGVAKDAADNSLMQLSIVEDVAGTLNWISEHGSYVASTDTAVNPNTVYFEEVSGDYVPIVNPDPTANPTTEGWYVLDVTDSQAEYIMAHLAVTSAGLWVLPAGQYTEYQMVDSSSNDLVDDASNLFVAFSSDPQRATGYKVLLSATGMTVFDDTGTAVAVYSDTVTIGATSGNNVHIDSKRVAFRYGLMELAEFGASFARIGRDDENNVIITPTGMTQRSPDSTVLFKTTTTEAKKSTFISKETLPYDDTWEYLAAGETVLCRSTLDVSDATTGDAIGNYGNRVFLGWFGTSNIISANLESSSFDSASVSLKEISCNAALPDIICGTSSVETNTMTATFVQSSGTTTVTVKLQRQYDGVSGIITLVWSVECDRIFNVGVDIGLYIYPSIAQYYLYTDTPAFTFGTRKGDAGGYSATIGEGLSATRNNQTVIGKYNNDISNLVALAIGNGSSDSQRSNALEVYWSGALKTANAFTCGNYIQTGDDFRNKDGEPIGERVSSEPSAVSTQSGKYYQAGSIPLTPGMWVIICAAEYASSGGATGIRRSWVVNQAFTNGTTTEPSGGQGYTFNDRRAGIASNPVDTHGQGILNITADTTLRQVVYQNSGTSVNVTGRMYAVRIA